MSHSVLARCIPALKGSLKFKEATIDSMVDGVLLFKKLFIAPIGCAYFNYKLLEEKVF